MKIQPIVLVSAVVLGAAGLVALFVPESVAALFGLPADRASRTVVQLLAGALFGLAMLDWMNRYATVGGIYGRPLVVANFAFFFMATTTLVRAAARAADGGIAMWSAAAVCCVLAALYGRLFFGGRAGAASPRQKE
jgi:hypothetical protein